MNRLSAAAWNLIVLVLAAVACSALLARHDADVRRVALAERAVEEARQDRARWQARYAEAVTAVHRDTLRVRVWSTRYTTVRDTLRLTDTVAVSAALEAADSVRAACGDLARSCPVLSQAADSVIAATVRERDGYRALYQRTRPSWRDRFGVTVGYGLALSRDGRLVPGVQVGASVRLFP